MKTKRYLLFSLLSGIFLFMASCSDELIEKYSASVPVYMSYSDLREAVTDENIEPITMPGKIYFKDNYIFINEQLKGIHVIDNSDPKNPVIKKFISIPGNIDMAIKGNILYADSYVDLVALDISNMNKIKETHRIKDIFPYYLPECPTGTIIEPVDNKKGVVLSWKEQVVSKEVQSYSVQYPYYYAMEYDVSGFGPQKVSAVSNSSISSQGIGVGGSMARFAINGDALYVINYSNILVFDIDDLKKPEKISDNYIGWNIETLFMYNSTLFVGSQTGMFIYDVSNPYNLNRLSLYQHVRSCDPVVVEGNYAYVTLRTGNACFGNINQLDVVNIVNKESPSLVKSYPMTNPKGLGIDAGILFVCDGPDGLKIYDAADINQIDKHQLAHFKDIKTFDVIPVNGLLFMIGDDGFYQYDYQNLNDIKLLSHIAIIPPEDVVE